MADIASVIQRGTEHGSQYGARLSAQAATHQQITSARTSDALKVQAMRTQMQGSIDQKAGVILQGLALKDDQVSAIRKAYEDEKDPSKKIQLETQLQAAKIARKNYVTPLIADPKIAALLDKASTFDGARATKMVQDALEVASPEEADQIYAQLNAIAQATGGVQQQGVGMEQEAMLKARGTTIGKAQGEAFATEQGWVPGKAVPNVELQQRQNAYIGAFQELGLAKEDISSLTTRFKEYNESQPEVAQAEESAVSTLLENVVEGGSIDLGDMTYDLDNFDELKTYMKDVQDRMLEQGILSADSPYNQVVNNLPAIMDMHKAKLKTRAGETKDFKDTLRTTLLGKKKPTLTAGGSGE